MLTHKSTLDACACVRKVVRERAREHIVGAVSSPDTCSHTNWVAATTVNGVCVCARVCMSGLRGKVNNVLLNNVYTHT